ncbi:MAG: TrbG/VirB9 family P-type conjugative transfer protein [Asticcacaulis sp.]|nr:TrbG/VirB9 family P-type conjugative transfer protein [Asticcacaulis sp.]
MTWSFVLVTGITVIAVPAGAAPMDPRIRSVDYVSDAVITVPVSTGVVTRIVLEPGEKIIAAATGVPSKCDNDQHVWCVVADSDANEVWIKPKAGARRNNLELKTDRRNYSFDIEVGQLTTYRVELRYPKAAPAGEVPAGPSEQEVVATRLANAKPQPKNLNYTLESNRKGADITPKAVFDDGVFTYFQFPGNTELPTIFVIGSDGQEARTNYNMSGDYMVVQRLGRKFVLRLGKSVVSVWNEAFDAQGVAPAHGTTVAGVSRDTVGDNHAN